MRESVIDELCHLYEVWLKANDLGHIEGDAEELVMFDGAEGSGYTLTTAQRLWVTRFIELWLATEVLEKL